MGQKFDGILSQRLELPIDPIFTGFWKFLFRGF
jgi:hypothetical protein